MIDGILIYYHQNLRHMIKMRGLSGAPTHSYLGLKTIDCLILQAQNVFIALQIGLWIMLHLHLFLGLSLCSL